jgi:L-2-hydroxyglutarate oxidase LhgO
LTGTTHAATAVVVGAGVVGLAVARELAARGFETFVLEADRLIGGGVSSRNSEVIHAGMYYPTASLKARHCVEGRRWLYDYCAERGVPHRRCGKLMVATSEAELVKLQAIHRQGEINGVEGLSWLDGAQARALEPALRTVGALWSPETGIIDSHALMLALRGDLEDRGGWIAFDAPLLSAEREAGRWRLRTGGAEPFEFEADLLVNAAGLGSHAVAAIIRDYPADRVPPRWLAKGNYFRFSGRAPFTHLIYPAPVDGGLGVHVTLDLGGQVRLGPDVEWIDQEDYAVDPARGEAFYEAARRYWPGLADGALTPDYCGVRPKICGPGGAADFMIDAPADHGVPGLVQLFGIESPGLTSSPSLARAVVDALTA